MTGFKGGDIVLVNFVFTAGDGVKQRPALVVSKEPYHKARQEIIVAAITSNTVRVLIGDTPMQDWKEAGLLFPSVITAVIRSMRQDTVSRKLGQISSRDSATVRKRLKEVLFV